jgi:antibiotic biosynthesis monooxygenase (ABM) superfamily enzyme
MKDILTIIVVAVTPIFVSLIRAWINFFKIRYLATENKKIKDQLFQILNPKNEQIFISEKISTEPNQIQKPKINFKNSFDLFLFRFVGVVILGLASFFIVKHLIDVQSISSEYSSFYILIFIGIFPPISAILTWINFFKIRCLTAENKEIKDQFFQILNPKNEQIFVSEKIFKEPKQRQKPKKILVWLIKIVLSLAFLFCWLCATFLLYMMQGITPFFGISVICTFIEVFATIWLIMSWINFFKIRYLAAENKKIKDRLFQILNPKN